MYTKKIAFAVLLSGLVISGCSTQKVQPRDSLRYLSSSQVNPLEYPPSLVKTTATDTVATTTLKEYRQHQKQVVQKVLPTGENAGLTFIESENGRRWINTGLSPDYVWQQIQQLVRQLGLEIESQTPEAGIIETKWAENQANVDDGFIRGLIRKVAGSLLGSTSKDKFKIRLERDGDRVLVFVTHYSLKDEATGNDQQFHKWVDGGSDPELEAEFLARLAARLGVGGDGLSASGKGGSIPAIDREGMRITINNRSSQDVWKQLGDILDDGSEFNVLEQYSGINTYRVGRTIKKRRFFFFTRYDREGEVYYIRVNEIGDNQAKIDIQPVLTLNHLEELVDRISTKLQ